MSTEQCFVWQSIAQSGEYLVFFLSDHKVDFTSDQPDHRAPGSVSGPDRFALSPTLLGHKKNCFGSEPLIKGTD